MNFAGHGRIFCAFFCSREFEAFAKTCRIHFGHLGQHVGKKNGTTQRSAKKNSG